MKGGKMRGLVWILSILFLISVNSCRTVQEVEKTSSEHLLEIEDSMSIRDSTRIIDRLNVRDSIRIKDSTVIVVDEQGNIIRKELYREKDRYRDLEKDYSSLQEQYRDLYLKHQESMTDTAYVERDQQLTRWQQLRLDIGGWAMGGFIVVFIAFVGFIYYKRR